MALSVLLPAVSPCTSHDACEKYVEDLTSAVQDFLQNNPASNVICGMDAHDPASQILANKVAASTNRLRVRCYTFQDQALHEARQTGLDFCHWIAEPYKRYTPICWMWQQLAVHAQCNFQPEAFVLLGDDTKITPARWVEKALGRFLCEPSLHCLILRDAADPGFPSFPVVRSSHFSLFKDKLLPAGFLNQGGDPFLMELYRSIGGVKSEHSITVHNCRGGPQLCDGYTPPLYERVQVPHNLFKQQLFVWQQILQQQMLDEPAYLTVDIAIPSYRANPAQLEKLLDSSVTEPNVSLRVLLQIDQPMLSATAKEYIKGKQDQMMHKLRVRYNPCNLGAGETRNQLLGASCAQYIIFFDDDVEPTSQCIDEYVRAARQHPKAPGFAGPTCLPHAPGLVAGAVQLSDVGFFWEAPSNPTFPMVPWAVTANLMIKNTDIRFQSCYPKTGGGEDVDFCLRLPGHLVSVPAALAHHPLWPGFQVVRHVFNWAYGDGQLLHHFPHLAYRRPPNALELSCMILLCHACHNPLTMWRSAIPLARGLIWIHGLNLVMDVLWNCFSKERLRQHPESQGLQRVLSATLSSYIKQASEAGRLWGHICRLQPQHVMQQFDWFDNLLPEAITAERRTALLRLMVLAGAYLCSVWGFSHQYA